MKTNRLIMYSLCLILLTACAYDKEEIEEAWASCGSATGNPSGLNVSGKVYEIDSINEDQPFFSIADPSEGSPSHGRKYTDDPYLDYYDNFTKDLSEASSVLCIKMKTTLFLTCHYPSVMDVRFTLRYYHIEADLTLLAWPSKDLITQTTLVGKPDQFGLGNDHEAYCPNTIVFESDEKARNVYERIDLDGWLEQYVTITK